MKKITLCGRGRCCPELHKGIGNIISITDDHGEIVTMTKEQWEILRKKEV